MMRDVERSEQLIAQFQQVRDRTEALTRSLSPEDLMLQSMPDASPGKWHLAHTTWFFETFLLLTDQNPTSAATPYSVFDETYCFLFNSYYNAVGERHPRPQRSLLSRPDLQTIYQYRHHVTEHMLAKLDRKEFSSAQLDLVELGIHHEMQHQELLLTDLLHAFSQHAFHPTAFAKAESTDPFNTDPVNNSAPTELHFDQQAGGLVEIGGVTKGFSFDCEQPRHRVFLEPYAIANRPVSNGDWLAFMLDGGYQQAHLWLSDGWDRCRAEGWQHPLYWVHKNDQWYQYGLHGLAPLDLHAPVSHVSYFEADAYASWAGARLPTEQEWEHVARQYTQPDDSAQGHFLEAGIYCPRHDATPQWFGGVWEWTRSAFSPYPGFTAATGAVGEYNGKFMSGQSVLRGGSCVTPQQQIRPSYRNFFYPWQRWQFSGLRLARDA